MSFGNVDLQAADAFAEKAHRGQTRNGDDGTASEVPYIVHPRAVMQILRDEHPEGDARAPWLLAVALLHDVLEDCDVHPDEITDEFGDNVCAAVRALSKCLRAVPAATKTDDQYWQVLAQAPQAVRRVKGADRLDNLRSLLTWNRPRLAQKYLVETPRRVLPLLADDPFLHAAVEGALRQVEARYAGLAAANS